MNSPRTKFWITRFQSLLLRIGQDLTDVDVTSLKFLLTSDISEGLLEKAQNATDLFTLMKKSEKLSYQETKLLARLLGEIKRQDLAKLLRDFEKDLHQSKSVPYNIKKERLVRHFKKTVALIDIEKKMENNAVVTISGPLGAGKSQMAIAFSTDLQNKSPECIIWYCYAKDKSSLLTSLRSLAEELSIPTASAIWSDTDNEDAACIFLIGKELQDALHEREVKPYYHLIILDDVDNESTNSVQNLIDSILTPEDPNIKFLITTRNKTLFKDYGKLYLNGFTPDESLGFLIKDENEVKDEERKNQYRRLAEEMGNLPLGLYTARTYMDNMSIGPDNFLELLQIENIDDIESQLTEMNLQSTEIKLFTAMKFCIYQDLKENMKPHVFEMFQMIQFLENEDIPICLLEFVYRENGRNVKAKTMLMSNFLVQALQKRSLGTIEGEDDNRKLSVHSSIIFTLKMCTSDEEKCSLQKKLLWGFSLLFDKDVFMNTDLLRMKLLIPHARSFLRQFDFDKFDFTADYEMLVLLTFVYDIVGYGYNFGYFKTISNEYSENSKKGCFRIMDCDEAAIDKDLKESCVSCDENSEYFYESLAKKKAEILWKKLDEKAESKQNILGEIVPRFILQRFRTQSNMKDLSKHLNLNISKFLINADTYKELQNKELALPMDCMTKYFLHELVLAVFYTYGRQMFYPKEKTNYEEVRRLLSYLFLAKEIGKKLSEVQPILPPLNALLSEITGILQSRIEDDAQLYKNKMEILQRTADRVLVLSSLKQKYHNYGIFKMASNHFQTTCLKLAIRCFTTMLKQDIDSKSKLDVYEKGCKFANKILERAKDLGDRRDIPGYKVRVAEFYISIEGIPSENLGRAEKLFLDVLPKDVMEVDCRTTSLERHELKAGYGLVKCYELSGKQQDAEKLKSKLDAIEK